ncbi:hypothetical protein BGZ90_005713 [Linnemannia elongata]|nr:hypothetical protein BGZ90_005713 [Linnemannia elongata]
MPAQHYQQLPAQQPAAAQSMFYPVQQKPAAASPSFHPPPLARVCCITFNEHNKIRLIGANPETIPPLRHAIANCGAGLEEDTPIKSDGHEFRLSTRPWHTKEKESIPSRLLLLAVLKAMAQCRWNVVQAARISKMDCDRDFLMFESVDPGLGAIEMAEADMFVMALMGKDKIRVIGAGHSTVSVVGAIKQAVLTHWKHPIRKDVVQELYHEFQFEGNPWAPHKAEEAAAKICMAQLLANIGSLGYKLYVSLDVHKSSKDSESECLVFRRVGRVWR